MAFRYINSILKELFILAFICAYALAGYSQKKSNIYEKQVALSMRMIGDQILTCAGDNDSRVMPIEKVNEQYKISFESDFGFDPDDAISIVDQVITTTKISADYLVEVEQCKTGEIVHVFLITKDIGSSNHVPCGGRALPIDCYNLLITVIDRIQTNSNFVALASENGVLSSSQPQSGILTFILLTFSLLLFLGTAFYFFKKRKSLNSNSHLIMVGASQFDKRSMTLTFEKNKIELSSKESDLLYLLNSQINIPIEREVILQKVWGDDGDYVGRTLDVFISKLRKKLEADTSVKIVNIRGVGYKLIKNVAV